MNKEKKLSSKKLIIAVLVLIIIGGSAFYGGMKYQQTKKPNIANSRFPGGVRPSGMMGNRQGGGNFIAGQIIAKDDKSITIKTQDGSSKIVYFSDSTTIAKSDKGSGGDLSVGQNINANGKTNSDGSIAATDIQIRNNQ